jgi:hypothetical protein
MFKLMTGVILLLTSLTSFAFDFEGMVRLSGCSGSLVRFDHSADADLAMILTNGHCLKDFIEPGDIVDHEWTYEQFQLLNTQGEAAGNVTATELIYATMSKTDIAIYRLNETYGEIESKFGIRPLDLARDLVSVGTPIEIISGYWKRGFACAVDRYVHELREGRWIFKGSLRYSRPGCEIIGGTSGAPVIEAGTRTVVAVNSSVNENGGRCTLNNPCEVDQDGVISYERGRGYGQAVSWLYSCLDESREVNLRVPGCLLPGGDSEALATMVAEWSLTLLFADVQFLK